MTSDPSEQEQTLAALNCLHVKEPQLNVLGQKERVLNALTRLHGRAATLMLAELGSGDVSPGFAASLSALVEPINRYIERAAVQARGGAVPTESPRNDSGVTLADVGSGAPNQERERASLASILADIRRLTEALDALIAHPQSGVLRARLESEIRAVTSAMLASDGSRPVQTPPAVALASNRSTPFDGDAVKRPPDRLSWGTPFAPDDPSGVVPVDGVAQWAGPGPVPEVVRLDESERQWWQGRFNRLRMRVNAGFSFIVIVVLALLLLDLYQAFAPSKDRLVALEADALGVGRAKALSDSREPTATAARTGTLGGPYPSGVMPGSGETLQDLNARLLTLETQVLRLTAGLDVISEELKSRPIWPDVQEEGGAAALTETAGSLAADRAPDVIAGAPVGADPDVSVGIESEPE